MSLIISPSARAVLNRTTALGKRVASDALTEFQPAAKKAITFNAENYFKDNSAHYEYLLAKTPNRLQAEETQDVLSYLDYLKQDQPDRFSRLKSYVTDLKNTISQSLKKPEKPRGAKRTASETSTEFEPAAKKIKNALSFFKENAEHYEPLLIKPEAELSVVERANRESYKEFLKTESPQFFGELPKAHIDKSQNYYEGLFQKLLAPKEFKPLEAGESHDAKDYLRYLKHEQPERFVRLKSYVTALKSTSPQPERQTSSAAIAFKTAAPKKTDVPHFLAPFKGEGLQQKQAGTAHSNPFSTEEKKTSFSRDSLSRIKNPTVNNLSMGELSVQELFGPDLKDITFQQEGATACYLLSGLDGILRHPQGKRLLDKIDFHKTAEGYQVKFPGQPEAILVKEKDLGKNVTSKSLGVKLIEAAYLKIPGVNPNKIGETGDALYKMFNVFDKENFHTIKIDKSPHTSKFIGENAFKYSQRKPHLQACILQAKSNIKHYADIMTAITNDGGHYYSIRLADSTSNQIALTDPFNTRVHRMVPIDQFLDMYHIQGARIRLS